MKAIIVVAALLLAGCAEGGPRGPYQGPPLILQAPAPQPAPTTMSCGRMGVWVNCYSY